MKLKKLLLSMVCVGAISFTSVGTAFAAETSEPISDNPIISPFLDYITSSRAVLTISSGTAYVSVSVVGSSKTTSSSINANLQQYKNGSWVTIQNWKGSGGKSWVLTKTKSVTKGYTYRVTGTLSAHGENVPFSSNTASY